MDREKQDGRFLPKLICHIPVSWKKILIFFHIAEDTESLWRISAMKYDHHWSTDILICH